MNYTQLTEKKKVEIDILLKQGMSMRKVAEILGISHSTISRYKAGIYKKRKIRLYRNKWLANVNGNENVTLFKKA